MMLRASHGMGDDDVTEWSGMVMECIFDKLKCTTPYGTAEQPADKMDDPYELGLRVEQ